MSLTCGSFSLTLFFIGNFILFLCLRLWWAITFRFGTSDWSTSPPPNMNLINELISRFIAVSMVLFSLWLLEMYDHFSVIFILNNQCKRTKRLTENNNNKKMLVVDPNLLNRVLFHLRLTKLAPTKLFPCVPQLDKNPFWGVGSLVCVSESCWIHTVKTPSQKYTWSKLWFSEEMSNLRVGPSLSGDWVSDGLWWFGGASAGQGLRGFIDIYCFWDPE